jgi:hypothetical protein
MLERRRLSFIKSTRLGYGKFYQIAWKSLALRWAIALSPLPARTQIYQATVDEIVEGNQVFIQETIANVNDIAEFQQHGRS